MNNFLNYSPAEIASRFINTTGAHIFLTGKAGTGKTTFLREIIARTHKKTIVAAPTGIAAINAGGVTLHSLFQLPFGPFIPNNNAQSYSEYHRFNTPKSLLAELKLNDTKRKLIREMELLIIDEVSMLRADLLDAIDTVLQSLRRNRSPFGGVQVLFIGDLLQLPPVVREEEWRELQNYYDSPFFFSAEAIQKSALVTIELDKIYRQSNSEFIHLLNNLRDDRITSDDIALLNKHYNPDSDPLDLDNYIFLTTHNHKADKINNQSLEKLTGNVHIYKAKIENDFPENSYPVEDTLRLKIGAQVMFIKNDISGQQRYYNGKLAKVVRLTPDKIEVKFPDDGTAVEVEHYVWENKRYSLNATTEEIEEKVIGTFSHYPLKLAWAITIHKSQGLTFERAAIDVSGAFAPGQIYVALSRLTSLDGLVLSAPFKFTNLQQDEKLLSFNSQRLEKEKIQRIFEHESASFLQRYVLRAFDFEYIARQLQFHVQSYDKEENRSAKQKYKNWAESLLVDFMPLLQTCSKFIQQVEQIVNSNKPDKLQMLETRIEAARKYFEPIFSDFSKRVAMHGKTVSAEKGIKAYLKELSEVDLLFIKQNQLIYKSLAFLNSVNKNQELTKEKLSHLTIERKPIEAEKVKKEDTKLVSFNLFKQGKSIVEIAKERGFVPSTIEGHLAHYVSSGELSAADIVPLSKIEQIKKVLAEEKTESMIPIKEKLGDEFSYSEIRIVIAELNRV